jgi:hypothetical protein
MTCKEMEIRLAGLIDDALPEEEKNRAEAHLRSCEACRKALADLRAADSLVKGLEEVEPPPWLKTRVMARVREGARGKESILRRLFYPLHVKVPIQAAATVLIAVVAWNVYRAGEPEFRQAAPSPARVQGAPTAAATATAPDTSIGEAEPAARKKQVPAQPPAAREDRGARKPGPVRGAEKADSAVAGGPLEASGPAQVMNGDVSKGAGTAAKETAGREAAQAAAPGLSAAGSARADLAISLHVKDPASAADGAEALLRDLGAPSIERTDREGVVTLTARILPEHLEAFREKLRSLGAVRERGPAAPRPGGPLAIRLEIRPE